jgi:hypothetical protein
MGKINDYINDSVLTGAEKFLTSDADGTTKNLPLTTLAAYLEDNLGGDLIGDRTEVSPASGDFLLILDATDGNLKKVDYSAITSGGFTAATITGQTEVTPASGDFFIIVDATDGNLKKVDSDNIVGSDNLGDHTATQDLDLNGNNLINSNVIAPVSNATGSLGQLGGAFGAAYSRSFYTTPASGVKWLIDSSAGGDLQLWPETSAGANTWTATAYTFPSSGTPSDPKDVVTKAYGDANYLVGDDLGDHTATQALDMDSNSINNSGTILPDTAGTRNLGDYSTSKYFRDATVESLYLINDNTPTRKSWNIVGAPAADYLIFYSENTAGGGSFSTTAATLNESGTPTLSTDLITKSYADVNYGSGYTDEEAQDAVGTILTDSSEIDFTYNDGTPSISASLITGSIDILKLDSGVQASLALADSSIQSDTTGYTGATAIGNAIYITQAGYDAISSPPADELFIITDAVDPSEPVSNTGNVISLATTGGNFMNMFSPNTNTSYTITGSTLGGWAKIRINASSQPSVTGATLISGSPFQASTDMYMYVAYNGNIAEYWFEEI